MLKECTIIPSPPPPPPNIFVYSLIFPNPRLPSFFLFSLFVLLFLVHAVRCTALVLKEASRAGGEFFF